MLRASCRINLRLRQHRNLSLASNPFLDVFGIGLFYVLIQLPIAEHTTTPALQYCVNLTDRDAFDLATAQGIIVFTLALRSLAGLSTLKYLQLETEEARRKERFLAHKIFNSNYNFVRSRHEPDELKKWLHPKAPGRAAFDVQSEKSRFRRWGALTIPRRMLPMLAPVPLFIGGSLSARSLVTSENVDLAGDAFRVDSALLWMDDLIMPDPVLGITAGILGFTAIRLSLVGARADIRTKNMANDQLNQIFFNRELLRQSMHNPVVAMNVNPVLNVPRVQRITFSGIHRGALDKQHADEFMSKVIQAFAFVGFGAMSIFSIYFAPAVMSLFHVAYFAIRIITEYIAQLNPVRNGLMQYPHLSIEAQQHPCRHLSRRFITLQLANDTPSDAFLDEYPAYQYKYSVILKRVVPRQTFRFGDMMDFTEAKEAAERFERKELEELSDDEFIKQLEK